MTRAAWLERRKWGFGASEAAMLLVLVGRESADRLPRWQQDRVRPMKRYEDAPRLLLEKAGAVKSLPAGAIAARGLERERELLSAWALQLSLGEIAVPEESVIDVESVRHASAVPDEWFPLRAMRGRIAVTPDAWCRNEFGDLHDIELKTTTGFAGDLRWTWQVQVQAQGLATRSRGAFVVAGERWALEAHRQDDGPIRRAFVPPDRELRRAIVEASEELWAKVESLRQKYGVER